MTASEMFGVPVEGMPSEVRRRAKAINFGIIYGISAFGLANQLGIPREEAGAYIKQYFERFPGIRAYMDATKAICRENGYVTTIFGRKCHYPRINASNPSERAFNERAAINAPIQGSAADIIRRAMARMDAALEKAGLSAQMLLQVHDELVFEVPDDGGRGDDCAGPQSHDRCAASCRSARRAPAGRRERGPELGRSALNFAVPPVWLAAPFAGLLLSIALGPILAQRVWHVHYGKAAAVWALLALALQSAQQGLAATAHGALHALLADYLPFMAMLFALYTAAGGIVVSDLAPARPRIIRRFWPLAPWRPVSSARRALRWCLSGRSLQANATRRHKAHLVIFFIFLVANVGGALSPLGDPPLFLGFLRGVDFFWPLRASVAASSVYRGAGACDFLRCRQFFRAAGAADAKRAGRRQLS